MAIREVDPHSNREGYQDRQYQQDVSLAHGHEREREREKSNFNVQYLKSYHEKDEC